MKAILLFVIVVIVVIGLVGLGLGQRITLVADEAISLQETTEGKKVVAVVPQGARLAVLGCEDDKSLIVPRVELASGAVGFVVYGKFHLERTGIFSGDGKGPISFSCPRF